MKETTTETTGGVDEKTVIAIYDPGDIHRQGTPAEIVEAMRGDSFSPAKSLREYVELSVGTINMYTGAGVKVPQGSDDAMCTALVRELLRVEMIRRAELYTGDVDALRK